MNFCSSYSTNDAHDWELFHVLSNKYMSILYNINAALTVAERTAYK
jgi:hypothetical protein